MGLRVLLPVFVVLALQASAWAQQPATSEPLAEVDGEAITAREVEQSIGEPLAKLEEQIYNLKREKVEAFIDERLLAREAAKRGTSVQALLDAEVTAKAGLVTQQDIDNFYQGNKAQFTGEEAAIRERIRGYLQNQKIAARRATFVQSLRAQAKLLVHLEAPPIFRAKAPVEGAPFRGSASAPVTIVEFADFNCPFCKGAEPALTQILSKYPGKVKLVHRDFPIDNLHPDSRKAHEAARCAGEQSKFWEYNEKLYASASKTTPEQLNTYAREVALDLPAFERCLNSRKYQAAVQKDFDEGRRLGVTGTPTFFINGRRFTGNQPLESFAAVIEEELGQKR